MKKVIFILIVLASFNISLQAQEYFQAFSEEKEDTNIDKIEKENLTIIQDKRLTILVDRHIEQNKKENGMKGYRIRIFSESGFHARDRSYNTRKEFWENYPDNVIYLEYVEPYYKLYVGDFRTRVDALKVFNKIKYDYPKAFIVNWKINFPPLD